MAVTVSSSPVSEEHSVQAWTAFLQAYANGQLPLDKVPELPPLPTDTIPHINGHGESSAAPGRSLSLSFEDPVYSSVSITPDVAIRVRDFYRRHSFLPPPRAPLETLREQIIQEYDLYSDSQVANIKAATDLVQAYFGGICTFTLFRDNVQELMAVSGPADVVASIGLHKGQRLLPETSLCGHSVLFAGDTTYVPNLGCDWRYAGNPYADVMKGVKSYLGSVISLNVDPASPSVGPTSAAQRLSESRGNVVGIGVINLMHLTDFLPPLRDDQKVVVDNLRKMLETQLRATWEGQGRTREARARRAVSEFVDTAIVHRSSMGTHAKEALTLIQGVLEDVDYGLAVDLQCLHPVVCCPSRRCCPH